MDSIRQHRPTVALVLSGGGAKGAAHIGTIRKMEQLGIPVDLIVGTSAGGLIGGMYAMGYTSESLDSLLRVMEWKKYFNDEADRYYMSYESSMYHATYPLVIPFSFGSGELASSLPSGLVRGQNLDYFFTSITVGQQQDCDFLDFPIPFMCVATDLVSGRMKLWHEGSIRTALRSTMAIPGVFAPVRTDNMVLLDGGMRNNFPTDVAKAVGADIVIGVTLSTGYYSYSEINNLKDILSQSMDLLDMERFQENLGYADVLINPDLTGFNALSFDKESVDEIFVRGYQAAEQNSPELERVARATAGHANAPKEPVVQNINLNRILISRVEFRGLSGDDNDYLESIFDIKAGERVDAAQIEHALSYIYGMESFESISYSLIPTRGASYALIVNCQYSPHHKVGVGARFDTETMVSAIVNISLNANKMAGHSLSLTGKLGSNPDVLLHYSYSKAGMPTLNADIYGSNVAANLYNMGQSRLNITYSLWDEELYLSLFRSHYSQFKAGGGNYRYNVKTFLSEGLDSLSSSMGTGVLKHQALFVRGRFNTLDDAYFPTRGTNMGFDASINALEGSDVPVIVGQADFSTVISGKASDVFVVPSIHMRMVFGENGSAAFRNLVGGAIPGRYLKSQIPFIGLNYATALNSKMIKLGLEVKYRLNERSYLHWITDLVKDSEKLDKELILNGSSLFGTGIQYSYNSMLGPLKANVHWSNLSGFGAYLSFGFDF